MERNERVAELDCGLEVWKLVISTLKEQDINAQVMDDRKMKILTSNIKNRGTLESLPYIHKKGDTFSIVSGHHRVRAANAAGLKTIYGLVDTIDLTESQIVSKQISHNELVGQADSEILGELVKKMKEVDDIIASGLPEKFLNQIAQQSPVMDLPQLDFDWRTLQLVFLPEQVKEFQSLVRMVDSKAEFVGVANVSQFDEFSKAMVQFGKTRNIKSIGATIQLLTEIALREVEQWQDQQNSTKSTTSLG
jgi:hypothetical protein